MFAPPPRRDAAPFARLPDALRIEGRTSRWLELNHGGRALGSFLEGPAFDRAGNLYLVDLAWGRILRLAPDGTFSVVASYDGAPCGLAIHRDGRVFIADWFRGILVLDPASGNVEEVVTAFEGEAFLGTNDLTFAANGDLYFTDQGMTGLHDSRGRLYRLAADGTLSVVVDHIPSPNGLAVAADQRSLLLNVTRDNAVWRVPLDTKGAAFKVGVYLRLAGGTGPDGMALAADGGVAIAHVGLGTVWLFDARGEPQLRIDARTGPFTTNIAYRPGKPELLIVESESGEILTCPMPSAGLPLFSHA